MLFGISCAWAEVQRAVNAAGRSRLPSGIPYQGINTLISHDFSHGSLYGCVKTRGPILWFTKTETFESYCQAQRFEAYPSKKIQFPYVSMLSLHASIFTSSCKNTPSQVIACKFRTCESARLDWASFLHRHVTSRGYHHFESRGIWVEYSSTSWPSFEEKMLELGKWYHLFNLPMALSVLFLLRFWFNIRRIGGCHQCYPVADSHDICDALFVGSHGLYEIFLLLDAALSALWSAIYLLSLGVFGYFWQVILWFYCFFLTCFPEWPLSRQCFRIFWTLRVEKTCVRHWFLPMGLKLELAEDVLAIANFSTCFGKTVSVRRMMLTFEGTAHIILYPILSWVLLRTMLSNPSTPNDCWNTAQRTQSRARHDRWVPWQRLDRAHATVAGYHIVEADKLTKKISQIEFLGSEDGWYG